MPSNYWIKLYHEILDDPKMGLLQDRLWRRAIELFLLAGDNGLDGDLPPLSHMAYRLHVNDDFLESDLVELAKVGIVDQVDGVWVVTNFAKRQSPADNATRQQQYRDRKRKEQYYSNDPVTSRYVDIDKDKDKDTDTDEEYTPPASPSEAIRRLVGQFWGDGDEPTEVDDLIERFGIAQVEDMAKWCSQQKMRSMQQAIKSMWTMGPTWKKPNRKENSLDVLERLEKELDNGKR